MQRLSRVDTGRSRERCDRADMENLGVRRSNSVSSIGWIADRRQPRREQLGRAEDLPSAGNTQVVS